MSVEYLLYGKVCGIFSSIGNVTTVTFMAEVKHHMLLASRADHSCPQNQSTMFSALWIKIQMKRSTKRMDCIAITSAYKLRFLCVCLYVSLFVPLVGIRNCVDWRLLFKERISKTAKLRNTFFLKKVLTILGVWNYFCFCGFLGDFFPKVFFHVGFVISRGFTIKIFITNIAYKVGKPSAGDKWPVLGDRWHVTGVRWQATNLYLFCLLTKKWFRSYYLNTSRDSVSQSLMPYFFLFQ